MGIAFTRVRWVEMSLDFMFQSNYAKTLLKNSWTFSSLRKDFELGGVDSILDAEGHVELMSKPLKTLNIYLFLWWPNSGVLGPEDRAERFFPTCCMSLWCWAAGLKARRDAVETSKEQE